MHVPEIIDMKKKLDHIKAEGLITDWELPYENLLTRLSAGIFFLTPAADIPSDRVWEAFRDDKDFSFRTNAEQKLSKLKYRVTFSPEEKTINEKVPQE
ncbi:MAG: hypothetical protein J0H74_12960 [Chitinophagaceae bacterium]|nr:hypothetical protein [Chitinophagaceae bacterium]